MKYLTLFLTLALAIVVSNALPLPEDNDAASSSTTSSSEDSKAPSAYEEDALQGSESQTKITRSIATDSAKYPTADDVVQPFQRITKALEEVSQQLGSGFKNFGNSAIQMLEGVDVAAEQAFGTGARIVTGIAETAAESAESGARKAIRIANGVASTLTQGTKSFVDTNTSLLKGLTGAVPSSLQTGASSTNEAVQRNERDSASSGFSGYPSTSYGPNTHAETPANFINVFSQAAANTVNFGTQLLNSLVGVAANILQGTVSTLLSLLNAKGQIVGAVVQSAPPVLASVTRTAGDVLAAKARIFGAVTQSAVNFASQLAQTITNTFSALFNGPNALNLSALTGGGAGGRNNGGPAAILGGVGNFASTAVNTKLNLLNGLLSPFTGGRPLLNFGGGGSSGSVNPLAALFNIPSSPSSSSRGNSGGYASSASEPNFRITIAATTPPTAAASSSTTGSDSASSSSGPNRSARYFPPSAAASSSRFPVRSDTEDLNNPVNLLASLGRGLFGGMLDQLGSARNGNGISRGPDTLTSANSNSFFAQILPNARNQAQPQQDSNNGNDATARRQIEQSIINSLLQSAFSKK